MKARKLRNGSTFPSETLSNNGWRAFLEVGTLLKEHFPACIRPRFCEKRAMKERGGWDSGRSCLQLCTGEDLGQTTGDVTVQRRGVTRSQCPRPPTDCIPTPPSPGK